MNENLYRPAQGAWHSRVGRSCFSRVCGCATPYLIRDTEPMENGRILSCTRLAFLQIFCLGKQPGRQAAAGLDAHFLHFILARDHIAAHFFEPLGGQFFQLVVHQIEA